MTTEHTEELFWQLAEAAFGEDVSGAPDEIYERLLVRLKRDTLTGLNQRSGVVEQTVKGAQPKP